MTRDLAGVVLAAGLGTRLRPLTDLRPKALCPVGGTPLLDLALDRLAPHLPALRHAGGDPPAPTAHLAVNAHHHAQAVLDHVGARAHVSVESALLGTAGALGLLRPWIDGRDVLLTNADAYLPGGLADLVRDQGAPDGQSVSDGRHVDPWDGERVRLLVRRLDDGPGDFVRDGAPVRYVGACLLPWPLVAALPAEPSGLYEVLWRDLDRRGLLDLVLTDSPVIDCGTPDDYLAANLHAGHGRSVIGAGAVVQGTVDRCVVWDGAVVRADEHLVGVIRAGTGERPVTVRTSVGA